MRLPLRALEGPSIVASVFMAVALMAFPLQSRAQGQKNHAEFQRLAQQARDEGTVRVIARLDVPGIRDLTAASVRFDAKDTNRATTLARTSADTALREAIEQTAMRVTIELEGTDHAVNTIYRSIPFMALRVSPEALAQLEASTAVLSIEEDVPVQLIDPVADGGGTKGEVESANGRDGSQPLLDVSVGLIGANIVWARGYTGSGWYVAILDTGIRTTHQFFCGKRIVEACYAKGRDGLSGAGDCPNGQDTMIGSGSAAHYSRSYAGWDHGTHVAGIAAGNYGSLAGVAKRANIIAVKIFSKSPAGGSCGGSACVLSWTSDQVSGLDYVYSKRGNYQIAAVNMSLGGGAYASYCSDARKAIIDNLRSAKIATVIATGNNGYCGLTGAPACISSAVAIGASDDSDAEAWFSNWHQTIQKLFAPGVMIKSSTGASNSSYASWNGTSMAAPHVTGAWALMRQKFPCETVTQLLSRLRTTGLPITSVCGTTRIRRLRVDKAMGY